MTSDLVHFLLQRGSTVLAWMTVVCLGSGALWPGQAVPDRYHAVLFGVLSIALGYGLFRVFLTAVASITAQSMGRLAFWYLAAVMYVGIFGPLLALLTIPFQWRELFRGELTIPMFIASFPSGLSTSLAAAHVIKKHFAEV